MGCFADIWDTGRDRQYRTGTGWRKNGARIFLKEVVDANIFTVAELGSDKADGINEKPDVPGPSYEVTGLNMYDPELLMWSGRLCLQGEIDLKSRM
jgi:dTDP-glucose pyrophosphorylase